MARFRAFWIWVLVFVGGFVSLGIEISASRLVEAYFGSSILVWATLIGLVLAYLSAGYFLGGKLADRFPRFDFLYRLAFLAGFFTGLVPLAAGPILQKVDLGALLLSPGGSLAWGVALFFGVALLFAVPVTLLGMLPPFALRLLLRNVKTAGEVGGKLYAFSTVGSILGAFSPPLVLIPYLGVRRTFLALALLMMAVALPGLVASSRWRGGVYFVPFVLIGVILPLWGGPLKQSEGLLYEVESPYNYVQVVKWGDDVYLRLNEGFGVQSVYNPHQLLTGGVWDYFLVAPLFRKPPFDPRNVEAVCILGLAGGTEARLYRAVYDPDVMDGVELDPAVVDAARRYLALDEAGVNVVMDDGRRFLRRTGRRYDVVMVDAYRPPYIPFHLTTVEFFAEVRCHLDDGGVVAVNVARTADDYRLVNAVAATMSRVFDGVFLVDEPPLGEVVQNTLVVGTTERVDFDDFVVNASLVDDPRLLAVVKGVLPRVREFSGGGIVLTDDHAPVERIVHELMWEYLRKAMGTW